MSRDGGKFGIHEPLTHGVWVVTFPSGSMNPGRLGRSVAKDDLHTSFQNVFGDCLLFQQKNQEAETVLSQSPNIHSIYKMEHSIFNKTNATRESQRNLLKDRNLI